MAAAALAAPDTASAANRIFQLHLRNATGAAVTFNLTPGSCYEGHSNDGKGKIVEGRFSVPAGDAFTFRVARVQGHDCDGKQGYFKLQPNRMQIQNFEFNNEGGLTLSNKVSQYIGHLGAKQPDEGYTWTMRSCPAGGCVAKAKAAAPVSSNNVKSYNRIFKLTLRNGLGRTVVFNISPGSCYEGYSNDARKERVQGRKPVATGGRFTFNVARVQGHGCDGKQGEFTVATSGLSEPQRFTYDNAGHLGLSNFPDSYNGDLSEKSEYDQSYTWTPQPSDTRVTRTKTVMIRHAVSKLYLIQGYQGDRDDKRNVEVQPIEGGDLNYRWLIQPVGGGWNHIVNLKTGLMLTWDGNDQNVSNWGDNGSVNNQWRFQPTSGGQKIINRGNNRELEQAYHGTHDDKRNVTTDGGGIWIVQSGPPTDLAKVTILSVKAIKASSGQDQGTKYLFQGIQMAAEAAASGGTSFVASKLAQTAGKQVAKKAIKETFKQQIKNKTKEVMSKKFLVEALKKQVSPAELAKRAARTAGLAAANKFSATNADSGLEYAFNKIYGESPDQLNLKVNGVSFWPNGGRSHVTIKSQQTVRVNASHIFQRRGGVTIELVEYDSGSADDSLGYISLDTKDLLGPETHRDALIISEAEKSVYMVSFKVEPLEAPLVRASAPAPRAAAPSAPAPSAAQQMSALVGHYLVDPRANGGRVDPKQLNGWHRGSIAPSGTRLRWTNEAGASWLLYFDPLHPERLHTGKDNPFYAKNPAARVYKLVWSSGKVTGFVSDGLIYSHR